nr:MAG TPA: Cytoplasmic tRNA 2-thiolation protein 2 [Caudoviricetes sp.]
METVYHISVGMGNYPQQSHFRDITVGIINIHDIWSLQYQIQTQLCYACRIIMLCSHTSSHLFRTVMDFHVHTMDLKI